LDTSNSSGIRSEFQLKGGVDVSEEIKFSRKDRICSGILSTISFSGAIVSAKWLIERYLWRQIATLTGYDQLIATFAFVGAELGTLFGLVFLYLALKK